MEPNFSVANVIVPKNGPKTIPLKFDFTNVNAIEFDSVEYIQSGKIEYIQALYVDNYDNPNPLTILIQLVNQRIIVPANSQGYYSVLAPNPPVFIFSTVQGAFTVGVHLLNVPVQPDQWDTTAGGAVPNPLPVTGPLTNAQLRAASVDVNLATDSLAAPLPVNLAIDSLAAPLPVVTPGAGYTDRSVALTGASDLLMAANANRKLLIVQNVDATHPLAINLTGAAAVLNGLGSMTIPAGGIIILDTVVPTAAIHVIGTAAADCCAWEA